MKATILDTKKLTILIADDHPSIRYGLKSILEDETYIDCVLEANCGTRVMEIMKTRYVDIIFMDVAMDYGDGITTTAQITKQFPNTKVIGISMYKEERYVKGMLANGAKGYLLKNADREIIIEAISVVQSGRTYISKEINASALLKKDLFENEITKEHYESLKEIIFLVCHEFNSKEIAPILNKSKRTIEEYRRRINEYTNSISVAGVIAYGIENGIKDDILLKIKFDKHISTKLKRDELV